MGIKISNLPAIVTPSMSDVFPVVQAGVTYKETGTQFSSLFATAGVNANITDLTGIPTSSWTPEITFLTPGDLTVVYTEQAGISTKAGNSVTVAFTLRFTPTYTTSSGLFYITNLPNMANSGGLCMGSCFLGNATWPVGYTQINLYVVQGSTTISLIASGSTQGQALLDTSIFVSGVAYDIYGSVTYLI